MADHGDVDPNFTLTVGFISCPLFNISTPATQVIDGIWIVPILSWHHSSWDRAPDIVEVELPAVDQICSDYVRCRFPADMPCGSEALARHIDSLNDQHPSWAWVPPESVTAGAGLTISFSHFLPLPGGSQFAHPCQTTVTPHNRILV